MKVQTTIHLDEKLKNKLRQIAAENPYLSVSEIINFVLENTDIDALEAQFNNVIPVRGSVARRRIR